MTSRSVDFFIGSSPREKTTKPVEFNLCVAYPIIENDTAVDSVVRYEHVDPRNLGKDDEPTNDGAGVSAESPLTSNIVKPYFVSGLRSIVVETKPKPRRKLLEIGIRDVKIHPSFNGSQSPIEISYIVITYKNKVICKSLSPFNRKLYKLLLSASADSDNLCMRIHARDGNYSVIPLPLSKNSVRDKREEVDFSIRDTAGRIHSGTVIFTVSLELDPAYEGSALQGRSSEDRVASPATLSEDHNDPEDTLAALHLQKIRLNEKVKYFELIDPALCLDRSVDEVSVPTKKREITKPPDIVVSEQLSWSMVGLSLGKWFQARRPLRPSSATNTHQLRTGREEIISVTVLRAVEVPVREESALVQPLMEIHWGTESRWTSIADGPAPVWQQTIDFEVSRRSNEQFVKFSLYDQHPIWGLQWLGDANIPLEFHRNYQEFERWIGLSTLDSPVVRFGYVQASPVRSYTRIYILMKILRPGNLVKSSEIGSSDSLAKSIQRCMIVPYKIPGTETPEDCAKLVMLLNPLPNNYGTLTARQALKLNKIDDYGRAALLATLLQGLGLDAYVLIGSSQARKWAAFVVSFDDKGTSPCLWDPENGEHYDFDDTRCSLIKASRMINHQNIWRNMQKSTTVPFNLRLDPKSNKDWQALPIAATTSGASSASREVQILEIADASREDEAINLEIESHLREKLSQWRSDLALTTIYNRHAVAIIRSYLEKFDNRTDSQPDKKDLRKLYRAYHTHGFVLNLRRDGTSELADRLFSTKIHAITGPVEFALVCRVQKHVAKTSSIWLACVVLRNRD